VVIATSITLYPLDVYTGYAFFGHLVQVFGMLSRSANLCEECAMS